MILHRIEKLLKQVAYIGCISVPDFGNCIYITICRFGNIIVYLHFDIEYKSVGYV